MRGRGMDSETARSYQASILKENLKRLNWFAKNYETLVADLHKPRKKLTDGILWEELSKKRAEMAQSQPRQALRQKSITYPKRDLDVNLDIMKPVPPEIHELIYHGISHEDEGKKGYLKVRYQEDPDDKFYFTESTNWVYGWGVNAVELHKLLRIPRVQIIKQSFYRRGGVERDPDHYRDAVKTEAPMFFPQL